MSNSQDTFLTPSQLTFTLKTALIGIELIYLPNSIIFYAKQDGWISCILGVVYPVYIFILADIICKKHPKENILILSKKYLGKFLGNILNFIFISFFLFMLTTEVAGFSNIYRVYTASFLKSYQVILTVVISCGYIAYKGVKPLGRLNEIGFYLTISLVLIPISVVGHSTYLNLMPMFSTSIPNLIKASKETIFFYAGMEILLLIYPFLQDNKKLLKCGILSTGIVMFIYILTILATIYYLGIETSPKFLWPIVSLTDSIHLPIINSFRYVFLSLWAFVVLKCISTYYFAVSYGFNQTFKKISAEKFVILLYPIIIILSSLYGGPTKRRYYTDKFIQFYVLFNLVYVSLIAIFVYFKKGDKYEKI